MEKTKYCPLLVKRVVVHNNFKDTRVGRMGINEFRDNEVILPEFLPCLKEDCMAYDSLTGTCLYCRKSTKEEIV